MHGTQGLPGNRRSSSEAAILDAAWAQFARAGPDGVSLRDVARDAGCSHTLLGRYFGSKDGLVDAVADRLTLAVATTVDVAWTSTDPLMDLLAAARKNRSCVQLLVRCGLGDLRPAAFAECLGTDRIHSKTLGFGHAGDGHASRRSRLLAYGASSLLLGWLTSRTSSWRQPDWVGSAAYASTLRSHRRPNASWGSQVRPCHRWSPAT